MKLGLVMKPGPPPRGGPESKLQNSPTKMLKGGLVNGGRSEKLGNPGSVLPSRTEFLSLIHISEPTRPEPI
eukprot:6863871-Pyramimonas_sp.AAC.1